MPYRDHTKKNTRSVFMMDRVVSFYVKTPPQVLVKGFQAFWAVFTSCCHLSQGNPVWGANGHKSAANMPLKLLSNLLYYDFPLLTEHLQKFFEFFHIRKGLLQGCRHICESGVSCHTHWLAVVSDGVLSIGLVGFLA